MRLLYDAVVFEEQSVGGISRIHRELLPRLCEQDAALRVLCLTTGRTCQPIPSHPRIEVRRILPLEHLMRPHRLFGRMSRRARGLALSLALRGEHSGVWLSSYYTRPLAGRFPSVAMVYDLIYELFPQLYVGAGEDQVRHRMRETITLANHVVCISEHTRSDVLKIYGVPASRTSVVYPGLSPPIPAGSDFWASARGRPVPSRYALYIGPRWHYKNFLTLLQAYACWDHPADVPLVCAGGEANWSPEERAAIIRLGLSERIRNLGAVSDEELTALYVGAQFLVLPSMYEGFGLPVLEAMQHGTLAVISHASSLPEVGADVAFYFDPADPGSIARAMSDALDLPGPARGVRIAAGRARAALFTTESMANQMLTVLREVAEGGTHGAPAREAVP